MLLTLAFVVVPLFAAASQVVALVVLGRSPRRNKHEDTLLTVASALLAGVGTFATVACLMLAFVPAPGGSGPVQYAGSDAAMLLFHFRCLMVLLGLLIFPLAAVLQAGVTLAAMWGGVLRTKCVAVWAAVLTAVGVITWVCTGLRWFPSA